MNRAEAFAATLSLGLNIPDLGYEFGPDPDPAWEPDEIRYYNLTLSAAGSLQFVFSGNSGVVPWTNRQAFNDLINLARADNVSAVTVPTLVPLKPAKESAPDMRVVNPCYVILHLNRDWNWHYLPGMSAIKLSDNPVPEYCGLTHCPVAGGDLDKPVGVPRTPPRAADICRVLYFAVPTVYDAGTKPVDHCNLYVQFAMDDNHYIPVLVDPDIKNDGGND